MVNVPRGQQAGAHCSIQGMAGHTQSPCNDGIVQHAVAQDLRQCTHTHTHTHTHTYFHLQRRSNKGWWHRHHRANITTVLPRPQRLARSARRGEHQRQRVQCMHGVGVSTGDGLMSFSKIAIQLAARSILLCSPALAVSLALSVTCARGCLYWLTARITGHVVEGVVERRAGAGGCS
jgi:hypothetical protein